MLPAGATAGVTGAPMIIGGGGGCVVASSGCDVIGMKGIAAGGLADVHVRTFPTLDLQSGNCGSEIGSTVRGSRTAKAAGIPRGLTPNTPNEQLKVKARDAFVHKERLGRDGGADGAELFGVVPSPSAWHNQFQITAGVCFFAATVSEIFLFVALHDCWIDTSIWLSVFFTSPRDEIQVL